MFETWLTRENAFIFRITAIQNLPFILQNGIACRNCEPHDPNFTNIGEGDIISKRDATQVTCVPFGILSDYVPFYFAPRSPMLGSIHTYKKFPQEQIIYLVSKANNIQKAGIQFVFSAGHAIMQPLHFYNDIVNLDKIDWQVMRSRYWTITAEDNDRKRRRMAEFLVHKHLPVELITGIGVKSEQVKKDVKEILDRFTCTIKIRVVPDWYY